MNRLFFKRVFKFLLGFLIGGGLIVGSIGAILFLEFLDTSVPTQKRVIIEKGWNLHHIAYVLEKQEIIYSARLFLLMANLQEIRQTGRQLVLHAGEYQFELGETPSRILMRLENGDVIRYKFSFPEGLTVREIASRMRHQGWSDAEERIGDPGLAKQLGLPSTWLEGWLFPETYHFIRGDSTMVMLTRMTRITRKLLDQEWHNRAPEITLTPLETLILASIIEKETGDAKERSRISGVFHNRLRQHMRLESDPTVIYGIADYQGDITHQHLITPTPYNTYTNFGLPPTPICNPGQAAIHAALHPDATDELFFVAQGDGTHVFAKTFQEHKANVNRFQKSKKSSHQQGKHETR